MGDGPVCRERRGHTERQARDRLGASAPDRAQAVFVDVSNRELDAEGLEAHARITLLVAIARIEGPAAVVAPVDVDAARALRDQDVLTERAEPSMVREEGPLVAREPPARERLRDRRARARAVGRSRSRRRASAGSRT